MSPTAKPRPALSVFPSALGWMAVVSRGGAIVRLTFGHCRRKAALAAVARCLPPDVERDSPFSFQRKWMIPDTRAGPSPAILRPRPGGRFPRPPHRPARPDAFQRRVLHACRQVGYGRTMTYGELAAKAGFPRAARPWAVAWRSIRSRWWFPAIGYFPPTAGRENTPLPAACA